MGNETFQFVSPRKKIKNKILKMVFHNYGVKLGQNLVIFSAKSFHKVTSLTETFPDTAEHKGAAERGPNLGARGTKSRFPKSNNFSAEPIPCGVRSWTEKSGGGSLLPCPSTGCG